MAIYYTIERLKVEGIVDIFQAIKNSRLHRVDLVSNLVSIAVCMYACTYVRTYVCIYVLTYVHTYLRMY